MNLIHLRYFVELSRTGSYTQAARRLCITQPSLSHAMAQLEEELGTELFRRQGRTTVLTPLGEQFLTSVCHSLDILDRGIGEVRQAARGAGLLRIGMVRPLAVELVPRLVGAFLKDRPEGEVRFTFHTDVTHALLARLEEKGCVTREKQGRGYLYTAALTRAAYLSAESRSLWGRLFGGSPRNFVAALAETDTLTDADIDELAKYLEELKKERK